jgi:hypothetical protein
VVLPRRQGEMDNRSPLPLLFCLDVPCLMVRYLMLFLMLWSMMMLSFRYDLWSRMWSFCSTGRQQYMMHTCYFLY